MLNRTEEIQWYGLNIPETAEYYQPANSVIVDTRNNISNLPRFFRKNFSEVCYSFSTAEWKKTDGTVNYSGAVLIPAYVLQGHAKPLPKNHSHYFRDVSKLDKIDIYMFLHLFNVTDPCLQHIIKKAACAGQRGAKDFDRDVKEICDTAIRLLEMREELK